MNISLIGSGNVAWYLGRKFQSAGHRINQVVNPHGESAAQLAAEFSAPWSNDLSAIDIQSDVVFLTVKDDALPLLNNRLKLGARMVVHTAGGVSMEAIKDISSETGVFYPLQTLRKNFDTRSGAVPLLLEANSESGRSKLDLLAGTISDQVVFMPSSQRLKMHVAAVFCNNFTNHLMALCEKFCQNELLDFSLLLPIMNETISRIGEAGAGKLQTGPARRGDLITMEKHKEVLKEYPEMLQLYDILSEGIRKYYSDIKE